MNSSPISVDLPGWVVQEFSSSVGTVRLTAPTFEVATGRRLGSMLDEVAATLDLGRPDSELGALNRASGQWFEMSYELAAALENALVLYERSSGHFSPVASGSGCGGSAIGLSGIERRGRRIRLPSSLQLNLDALLDGILVDAAVSVLQECGGESALVSAGDVLRTVGESPTPGGWAATIDAGTVRLGEGALAADPYLSSFVHASDAWLAAGLARTAPAADDPDKRLLLTLCGARSGPFSDGPGRDTRLTDPSSGLLVGGSRCQMVTAARIASPHG
jgi:hypothetical protein